VVTVVIIPVDGDVIEVVGDGGHCKIFVEKILSRF
jgi:hypothetical protein